MLSQDMLYAKFIKGEHKATNKKSLTKLNASTPQITTSLGIELCPLAHKIHPGPIVIPLNQPTVELFKNLPKELFVYLQDPHTEYLYGFTLLKLQRLNLLEHATKIFARPDTIDKCKYILVASENTLIEDMKLLCKNTQLTRSCLTKERLEIEAFIGPCFLGIQRTYGTSIENFKYLFNVKNDTAMAGKLLNIFEQDISISPLKATSYARP